MAITVIKRDGRKTSFEPEKITNAISAAGSNLSSSLVSALTNEVLNQLPDGEISVETIQDLVEKTLVSHNLFSAAKSYILYRNQRAKFRDLNSDLTQTINNLVVQKSTDSDLKRENANINADAPMGIMLKFGSEASKHYSLNHLIKPEQAEAHLRGDLHIHDLDFFPLTLNCLQIPAGKLLEKGFFTGHGLIRSPNSIQTAAALMCIIIQSSQNDHHR